MAPTEYRAVAKRADLRPLAGLRHAVAAGEPLNPEVVHAWREGAGVEVHDGCGQTETGALTGMPLGPRVRPVDGTGSAGLRLWVEEGELCVDPATVPTFFLDGPRDTWRTGDRVTQDEDSYFWFEGRGDDVIISAGYRIRPFEVESALLSHPSVARPPRSRPPTRFAARRCAPSSSCATVPSPATTWPGSCRSTSSARPLRTSIRG